MERMAGIDAGFLAMETPSQHMHTLKIAVLDVSGVPGGYSFDRFREVLTARLDRLPPFRRRTVQVPGRLHHPVWIADPDFDLDAHLRRVELPAPGSREQLDDVVSSIASRPLDRRRPLWELTVVEGLADGTIAFVAKLHHCIADGVTAAEMLLGVLDTDPDADAGPDGEQPAGSTPEWRPDAVPSRTRLVLDAITDLARSLTRVPALLVRTVRGLANTVRARRARTVSPPLPFTTPKLRFNRALTPRRRFVSTTLPLADVKRVKQALGCSVNDVVLALCTGALRRYLDARGELPDRALVASVPVSTRVTGTRRANSANNVSNLFTTLPVQLDDARARVAEIHAVTAAAKDQLVQLGPDMLADWSELTPPLPFAAGVRAYSRLHLADRHRPPINLVVSNVPGPTEPLYVAGGRLVDIFSVGPILENAGLNITVWSYLDGLDVGMLACEDAMPDLRDLADDLHAALDELRAITAAPPAGTAEGAGTPTEGGRR
jgi:diacylglycerol O-acyltransferase